MRQARTAFQVQQHGFRFVNFFTWGWRRPWLVFGLCGGMCLAALDYFLAGKAIPADEAPPPTGSPLFSWLTRRQWDSFEGIRVPLRAIGWMWRSERARAHRMAEEFLRLAPRFEAGEPAPLCVIRALRLRNPTLNHQVLALGYSWDEASGQVTLPLYDPNHPLGETSLSFVLEPSATSVRDATQSTQEAVQGFFAIKYTLRDPGNRA